MSAAILFNQVQTIEKYRSRTKKWAFRGILYSKDGVLSMKVQIGPCSWAHSKALSTLHSRNIHYFSKYRYTVFLTASSIPLLKIVIG